MAQHNDFGKEAEQLAADFLAKKGYKILARNFRYLKAEVDIICELRGEIIFVEVKARGTDIFQEPHEAVTNRKIKQLVSAADEFMKNRSEEARFDIVSVLPDEHKKLQVFHIENAFTAMDAQ